MRMRGAGNRLPWYAAAAAAGAVGLCLALGLLLAWLPLPGPERAQFAALVARGLPLLALAWAGGTAAAVAALQRWWLPQQAAWRELAEQTRAVANAVEPLPLKARAHAGQQALVEAINALAAQRDGLRGDVAAEVARAGAGVHRERNRLAALMSELTQSVVVCNRHGRILLYNNRARLQFRALSEAPHLAGGAELIGIGRSIYAVFDERLVAHALERVQQRLAHGAPHPSAQFVTTTRGGQLLRAQLSPVTDVGSGGDGMHDPAGLEGFVLLLDNITRNFEEEAARDQWLHTLTEGSRASLATAQAALDALAHGGLGPAPRERSLGVLRREIGALAARVDAAARHATESLRTRWPLEEVRGSEFVQVAARQLARQCAVPVTADEVDNALWLRLDSFSMLQALEHLGGRLVEEFAVRSLQLRLARQGGRAQLDLVWSGHAVNTETVTGWEIDPMRIGGEPHPLSVRDVLGRHGAEIGFERDRVAHQACFRLLLPLAEGAAEAAALAAPHAGRPEFFDFDLFADTGAEEALDDCPLSRLICTVFDTETTGLDPSGGDEILQIGAVRVVNGRLLRHEAFEQLVDPGRNIPAAGIPIHGITPAMVAGQPKVEQVLPAFHQFARDTVLVGHNAAFDMRFLQLLEPRTGLRFAQPVLDTLLLSALVHPHQESHRLEAIAERLGVPVPGRHTALGDALATAGILLRLIPLLRDMGIVTLGQARARSRETYYARLTY
ncbi:3'-5' exonuclease [Melaminivora sp.]|uniref:3'-5' exonuclease n=1 Tax=Melaminivora sp. TaxID=1933032 RepID=UPI0028AE17C8|nr:3'-5' exonuclease [Melaminivora sp.]